VKLVYTAGVRTGVHVFAICENGDYIQDEKHVIFSCMGTAFTAPDQPFI